MKSNVIPLDSYTSAKRAVMVLSGHGIRASVVKTGSTRHGCTFGIKTSAPPDKVCGILERSGIRCGDRLPFPPPPPPPAPPHHIPPKR